MNDSIVYNYTISRDNGEGRGGSTPPVTAVHPAAPPVDPVQCVAYIRRYYFTEEEGREMVRALEAGMAFLLGLRTHEGEGQTTEAEPFLLPPGCVPDLSQEDWLPF